MKRLCLTLAFGLLCALAARAIHPPLLNVSMEYEEAGDRVYLIVDSKTQARCVAITNDVPGGNGYAISCLPDPAAYRVR